jgi:hypothetical protein
MRQEAITQSKCPLAAVVRTIVTTDERIPIPICHRPIYMLLGLFKRDVHVPIKARQYTFSIFDQSKRGAKGEKKNRTTVVDSGCQADYNSLSHNVFQEV